MLIVVKNDNLRRSAETIQRYRHRERGREISPPLDVHDFTWHFGALSGQNYRPVVDSFPLSARRNPIDNTGFYIATAAATRNHSCIPRLFEPTRLVMSVEDGFDRERILEWLLGVANPADPNRQSEPDRGLTSNPDTTTQAPTPPSSLSQQQQQQQQHKQQHKPQRLLQQMSSPRMLQSSGVPTPLVILCDPQTQQSSTRALSLGAVHVPRANRLSSSTVSRDLLSSQQHHRRKKSESPLPDAPADSELPTFTPHNLVPPGRRVLKQHASPASQPPLAGLPSPLPSSPSPPKLQNRSSVETISKISGLSRPAKPFLGPTSPQQTRRKAPETGNTASLVGSGMAGEDNQEEVQGEPIGSHGSTTSRHSESTSKHSEATSMESVHGNSAEDSVGSHRLSTHQTISECTLAHNVSLVLPAVEPVAQCEIAPITECVPPSPPSPPSPPQTAAVKLEEDEETVAALTPIELATLSLHVVDILPQLTVYLCMDYGEYERLTREESSPQRQSMKVLMKWYGSGNSRGRLRLVRVLEQCGGEYCRLAELLQRRELEDCRQPAQNSEERYSEEEKRLPRKLVPSPLPSTTPASLSHRHRSPSPSPSHPTQSPSQPSPEEPKLQPSPPSSPSPPPPFSLSVHTNKLKQGFAFDDDQGLSNNLPKFLSNRSLHLSPDSSHLHSPHLLRSHSHHRHSQRPHRRTSFSDVSSSSTASSPAAPGFSSSSRTSCSGKRKASLQIDEMIQLSGGGGTCSSGGHESGYFGGRRVSSLQSDELLRFGGGRESVHASPLREGFKFQSDDLTSKQSGSGGGAGVGLGVSKLAGSHTHRASGPAPLRTSSQNLVESRAVAKGAVEPSPNFLSLETPLHRLSLSESKLYPSSSSFDSFAVAGGREQSSLLVETSSARDREASQHVSGSGGRAGLSPGRRMKRQDSGIETLLSNFSAS